MANPNISQIVTTTLENQIPKITDNILNNNALLMRLNQKGKMKMSGGRLIRESLSYQENGTVQWQGEYDTFDTTPQDVLSSADYNWKILTGTVTMTDLEMKQNKSKEQIINLLKGKQEVLRASLENTVGSSVYADGTTATEIGGLQQLVADDPTTGSVGGIDRASFNFWRNQLYDFSVESVTPSSTTMIGSMNVMYRRCSQQGKSTPDLVLADNTYYGYYEAALQNIHRVTTSKMADAGFDALKYKSADVVYDPQCPAEHMYFLNTDHLFLKFLGRQLFEVQQPRDPYNQPVTVYPVIMTGNMTINNARVHGVMIA